MTSQFSNIRFIVNPAAGPRQRDIESVIRDASHGTGVAFEVAHTAYPGHATELARAAAGEGVECVVAVGGDGTVNEVGSGLVGTETALGIVPIGSGNALARGLGVPLDPNRACSALMDAQIRPMDAGQIGDRYFFSTAGVGLDAEVSWRYNRRQGGRRGFLPYVVFTLGAFWSYRPEAVQLTLADGTDLQAHPIILTVANTSQFGNGATIAPGARPDDGLLDLCIIENAGLLRMLWHAPRLFTGTIYRMPGARFFQTTAVHIHRSGPGHLQLDGEAMESNATLDVKIVPQAIRIALPNRA